MPARPHGTPYATDANNMRTSTATSTSFRDQFQPARSRVIPLATTRRPFASSRSVCWLVNRELIVLLGWTPAVLMQFAHPLVAEGVARHSEFGTTFRANLRRLQGTVGAMLALTFGTAAQAEHAALRINAIHDTVHGRLAVSAGRFPAGTGYCAHDPALLLWVHATLQYMLLRAYQLYVGPLTRAEQDCYVVEVRGYGPALGLPLHAMPATADELRQCLRSRIEEGVIEVTPTARRLARQVLEPAVPAPLRPMLPLLRLPAIGLLPAKVRDGYGFTWQASQATALRRSAALCRMLLPFVPDRLRYWPVAR